jgi:uncharacterized membrane protein HdeD (DUF308 family)
MEEATIRRPNSKESIVVDSFGISDAESLLLKNLRIALGVGGVVSLIFGVLILIWPGHTAAAVVAIFVAVWTLVAGLGNLAIGIFGSSPGRRRILYLLLGALFLIGGIVAWANLGVATEILAVILGTIVGVVWIIQGAIVLATSPRDGGVWPVLYAVISILAGVALLIAPVWGATLLWLWIGISLVVVGVIQLVRAIRFTR